MSNNNIANETRLVLIGKTGSGKSATGNTILGKTRDDPPAFHSSTSGSSITKFCSYAHGVNCGKKVSIVDTPGLYDTGMSVEEVTAEIALCVTISAPGPHAIIFVTRIGRFTEEERKTIQHFVDHFGEGMYKYMIVLFTGGDDLEYDRKSAADYIRESPPALREILHLAGNRYMAFNNRTNNSDQLQQQVSDLLTIVNTNVMANGGSYYTNAMYLEAEAKLAAKEEQKRLAAEAKKREEEMEIRRACRADMEQELRALESKHEAAMNRMRDDHRATLADMAKARKKGSFLGRLIHAVGNLIDDLV